MTPREPKNNPVVKRYNKIDDVAGIEVNNDTNLEVKEDINTNINVVTNNDTDTDINIDKIKSIKNKLSAKKKASNKQVTIYLTPINYKRFNSLKEKGAKSELINELLNAYFED